jgi:hypothetical protein
MAAEDGWEYQHIVASTLAADVDAVTAKLNELGALGWQVVGFASADPTIGVNAVIVYVGRRLEPPAPAGDGQPAAWLADPTGRFEKRYWNGSHWTAHVADTSKRAMTIDPPTMRARDR